MQHGISLSLITMVLWALTDVFARYSATVHGANPIVYVCISLMVSSLVLIIIAGSGRGGTQTVREKSSWSYSFFQVLMNIFEIFAYVYISTTEANFLIRLSIIFSLIMAWMFFRRKPSLWDGLGVSFILIGAYNIIADIPDDIRIIATIYVVLAALSTTIRTFIAETHPQSNEAGSIKDRCRVTGYILSVTSFVFVSFVFMLAYIKAPLTEAGVLLPLVSSIPEVTVFLHLPTLVLATITGLTILPAASYFYFYASRVAKTEMFMIIGAFLPFFTYIFEYATYKMGLLDISTLSMRDLTYGSVIIGGALVMLYGRTHGLKKSKPQPASNQSADYEMVQATLRFCENDLLKASKLLGVSAEILEAVDDGEGEVTFNAKGNTYKTILRNYHRNISIKDKMTGLVNKDALLSAMNDALKEKSDFCVVFVDLDKFKPINDTYGHEAGDTVLKNIASRMEENTPNDVIVARIGGDEFALLLKDTSKQEAEGLIQSLGDILQQPIEIEGLSKPISVGASFGVASSNEANSPEELLKLADKAMYKAKENR